MMRGIAVLIASAAAGEAFSVSPLMNLRRTARISGCLSRARGLSGPLAGSRLSLRCSSNPLGDDGNFDDYGSGEGDDGAFQLPKKKTQGFFGSEPAKPSPVFEFTYRDMTEELFERMLRVCVDAMDNYPPQEVERKLRLLWKEGPEAGPNGRSMRGLAMMVEDVEGIENEAMNRVRKAGSDLYDLEDAIRIARSQVRSLLSDSDYYDPNHWLSKGDISGGGAGWFNFFGGKK